MDTRGPTLVLVAALALVVGAAGGAWLASGQRQAREEPTERVTRADPAAELAPVLAELTRTLEALRRSLETAPARPIAQDDGSPAPSRVPLDPMAARDDRELVAALNALAAGLRGLDLGGASATRTARPLVVPARVDRHAAFASASIRSVKEDDDEVAWDRAMNAWREEHLLWTAQQVLDAYGKPDEIQRNDGDQIWTFNLPVGDDQESFEFYLSDGLVYEVDYDGP